MQPRDPNNARGIDVSRYQGDIDWPRVKAAGISFAFIKATEGHSMVDTKFAQNLAGARVAGVAVGAYHFLRATDPMEAVKEADSFITTARRAGYGDPFDLPPALDVETIQGIPRQHLILISRVWMERVKDAFGMQPIVYTYPWFAATYLDATLSDVPLWYACYDSDQPAHVCGWSRWTFLQCSNQGNVPGIRGPVDMNEYEGSVEELLGYKLSKKDADDIIERFMRHEYDLASPEDKEERHRLANELRKASGQPKE